MKRDMELVRTILFTIEENNNNPMGWIDIELEGYSPEVISYHVQILSEAGMIEATNLTTMGNYEWKPISLTWNGHEFIDSIKNDTVWNEVKRQVKEKGGSIPLEVLKVLAIKVSTSFFLG